MNVQFIVFSSYLQLNEITSYIRFSWSSQQIFISKLLYINLRMMKQNCKINPQYAYKVIAYPDVSTLPSETKFVYIVNLYTKKAYVEIFDNEEIKIKEILKRFLDKTKYKVPDAVAYILTLKTGLKIDHEMSIGSLKNILLRDSMQGFQFKIQHLYKVEKEKQYDDQCSVLDYYRKEYGSRIIICVKVIIILKQNPNASELMLFKINRNDDEETTLKNLLAQLSNTYQNMDKLSKDEIVITKIKVQKISGTKTRQKSDKNFSFLRGRVFFDNYQLQVLIARKNLKQLKRRLVKRYNSVLCIYKEGEKQPQKFKYDEIADLTVQQLYFNHLQLQESQKKKQAIYCLKISDLILNPEDKICKAQVYFAQQKAGVTKNVVAKVVNQKMIFYYVIPKISQRIQDQFTLQSIKIPEHQDNARKQFSRILEARSQKASNDYFKKKKNLEPIVIYSSELIYYQQETKQDKVIYQALNKSLREAKTFSLDFQEYKSNWKLVYASTLLKHLDKISDFKGETWRGISFDPNYKKQHIGYIFTFKQFLSTSLNQHTAVNFAIKYDSIQPYHMYHFKVLSGKNIIDYSFYEEGEILIQPFTQFQLVRIRVQKINGKKFIVYDMQERETQKKIPEIINNFIIWIDINPKDGKQIFDSISETYDSTIFIQLKSTEQFEAWTIRHSVIFNNPDAKIIFITNMTRKEGDSYNEYAGIESLALARNRKKNIHAYFYIGDIDACYKKLTNKNVSLNYLKVTNNPNQMKEFLQDQLMQ